MIRIYEVPVETRVSRLWSEKCKVNMKHNRSFQSGFLIFNFEFLIASYRPLFQPIRLFPEQKFVPAAHHEMRCHDLFLGVARRSAELIH